MSITEVVETKVTNGIVCYNDGGARDGNPGRGGWGMHGYMYSNEVPKKSSGNQDYILTSMGYVSKTDAAVKASQNISLELGNKERRATSRDTEITPVHYIDGYGSFAMDVSNNVAELVATISSLTHAADFDITEVQIFTDSRYVSDGLEKWVSGWIRNNWLKQDLTEPANISYWKQLVAAKEKLTQRGIKVKINWVRAHTDKIKGHSDILGNILADKLATIGVMGSKLSRATSSNIKTTPAEGYWKYTVPRHPFLYKRSMYFNTVSAYIKPGEYYVGDQDKEVALLGKRISDGSYAVVRLKEPDEIIEMIRDHQVTMAGVADTIIMMSLDQMFKPTIHRELSLYGILAVEQENKYKLDLGCIDREPLTTELRTPKLAMRSIEALSELSEKLELYLNNDKDIIATDLTELLYDTSSKTNKKEEVIVTMKLKEMYNVGFAAMTVETNYFTEEGIKSVPVTLTLGIDILDRNALKRLDEELPKVTLISWLEAPGAFRYATVIEAAGNVGIWCSTYANLRFITS